MNPGHTPVCRCCAHFLVEAFDQGHVNPCRLNRWEETRHVAPELSADGRACDGFEPRAEEDGKDETAAGEDAS